MSQIVHAHAPPPDTAYRISNVQLISLIIVVCLGFSSQILMPMWIGQIIDGYHISPPAAGRIASAEMFLVACTCVVVALLLRRLRRQRLALVGMLMLLVGNFLCIFLHTVGGVLLCRAVTGIGKGLLVAALFSIAGQTPRPTRTFALINAAYAGLSAAAFLAAPYFVGRFGAQGIFALMAALALLGVLWLPWLPQGRTSAAPKTQRRGFAISGTGIAVIAAFFLFWTAHEVIWTFAERLGVRVGLDLPTIGKVLAASALAAVAGPVLAHALDLKYGVLRPLVVAIVVVGTSGLALSQTHVGGVFVGCVLIFSILTLFATPYFQGLLSAADPLGRLAALSVATSTFGGSCGALLGSAVLAHGGYSTLGPVGCGIFAVVLSIVIVTLLRHTSELAPAPNPELSA
jgi:DHA1 family inner membrane transport protein